MSERHLRIAAMVAVVGAFVATVLGFADIIIDRFELPLRVYLSCLLFVLGTLLSYIYTRTEALHRHTSLIERRMSGATVETFHTRDTWLQRMIELGVKSPFVDTLHYSDPPSILGGRSAEYFQRLHRAVSRRAAPMIYRRVATVSNPEKARWLLETVDELRDCQNFSLAFVDLDHQKFPLLCMEVGKDNGVYYTFFFTTVPPTGAVTAVLVRDNAVGEWARAEFERIWGGSHKLKEGAAIHRQTVREFAQLYDILQSKEYRALQDPGA